MKTLFINPVGVDFYNNYMTEVLNRTKSPNTTVTVRHLTLPDEYSKSAMLPNIPVYLNEIVAQVVDAESEGFDSVIVGCCTDPALSDSQRSVSIPVIGPLKAAATVANLYDKDLTILSPDEHDWKRTHTWTRNLLRSYGLLDRLAEIRFVPMHTAYEKSFVDSADVSLKEVLERFDRQLKGPASEMLRDIQKNSPSTVVLLGCTLWGGLVEGIRADFPDLILLDPVELALQFAEIIT
jgi:allantoin racemase